MALGNKSKGGRPSKAKASIGKTFGRLTVIEFVGVKWVNQSVLKCRCVCGNFVERTWWALSHNPNSHCGCLYRSRNPEHRKAICAKWQRENRERVRLLQKADRARHAVKRSSAKAAWRAANPDKVAAIRKRFNMAHPERVAAWKSKRRAILKGAVVEDVKAIERWEEAWRGRHAVRCYWCGGSFAPRKCHVDHVVALSLGGAHALDNVCISCGSCNASKGARDLSAWNARIDQPVLL